MWLYASCVLMHVVMWCCMITTLYAYVHLSSGSLVIHELGEFLIRLRVCWAGSPMAGSQCCCAMLGAMIWCAVYLGFTHSAWSWRLLIYLFSGMASGSGTGQAWLWCVVCFDDVWDFRTFYLLCDVLRWFHTLYHDFWMTVFIIIMPRGFY